MLGCCLALLLRAAAAVPGGRPGRDVGICYTRNMVHLESHVLHVDALRKVVLSASSLRRADGGLATCLFTEMDAATVHATTRELVGAKLFDRRGGDAAAAHLRHMKMKSRVGRILNLGAAPFELTLFVDDDTFFCDAPSATQTSMLREALLDLHRAADMDGSYDVRAHVFSKRRSEKVALRESHDCVWAQARARPFGAGLERKCNDLLMGGRPFCSGAQGGAFAVSRGPRAAAFARDWLDRYLAHYAKLARRAGAAVDASWGGDQAPLAELMGALRRRGRGRRFAEERLLRREALRRVGVVRSGYLRRATRRKQATVWRFHRVELRREAAGGVVAFCWSGVGDGGVRGDRSGERRVALRRGEASCAAALGGARPDGPGDDDAVFVLGAGDDRVAWMAASMGERDAWVEAVAACLEEGGDASRPPAWAPGGGDGPRAASRPSRRPSPASRAGDRAAFVRALRGADLAAPPRAESDGEASRRFPTALRATRSRRPRRRSACPWPGSATATAPRGPPSSGRRVEGGGRGPAAKRRRRLATAARARGDPPPAEALRQRVVQMRKDMRRDRVSIDGEVKLLATLTTSPAPPSPADAWAAAAVGGGRLAADGSHSPSDAWASTTDVPRDESGAATSDDDDGDGRDDDAPARRRRAPLAQLRGAAGRRPPDEPSDTWALVRAVWTQSFAVTGDPAKGATNFKASEPQVHIGISDFTLWDPTEER
ncbi:hypothetical protein JL722_1377 [Aureococcus anophagefferens]|nr:hypothetical protein JL722_1377 [Aureococcus anophagefferens]